MNTLRFLSLAATLAILSGGTEGRDITNCRKYFHKLHKRSEDGYSFLSGYQVTPTDEVRNNCTVYDTTPPPLPPSRQVKAYYVYPVVIDPGANRMYSAAGLLDLRRGGPSRGTLNPGRDAGVSGSLFGQLTPQGANHNWMDFRSIQSLLRQGKGSYVPPVVVMGKAVNLTALRARSDVVVSRGFSRPVVMARPASVVPLPSAVSEWCSSRLGSYLRQGGLRCASEAHTQADAQPLRPRHHRAQTTRRQRRV